MGVKVNVVLFWAKVMLVDGEVTLPPIRSIGVEVTVEFVGTKITLVC